MPRFAGVLLACVTAFVLLAGAPPAHAQVDGIFDVQCQQNAVNQCDVQCGDVGPCKFGCQVGGINNADTCNSSCIGLGAPCLNACLSTVQTINICQLPTVGGVVSGLGAGKSVVLQNNGGDNLTVGANGAFTFPTSVVIHTTYAVTVSTQPAGQRCVVANGFGLADGPVTNVAVSCISAVPTLSNWGTVLLAGMLTLCGLVLFSPVFARASSPEV